ncbi:MAG: GNAT family N-acetyltransferase [Pseudomonadota bacterium]
MSTAVEIRPAIDRDREAIQQMAQEVVDAGDAFVFDAVPDVMDYWSQPGGHVFVATRGADVLGTYVIKPNQKGRGSHVANTGYMVSKAARGLGLGRSMGEHSLTMARELGFTAMQFNMVVATNESAVRLWESLEFEVVGRLPRVFRHADLGHVDALIMFRAL